jgi:hypothetical protein
MCATCVLRFGTRSAWPCAPVRVAEIYSGLSLDSLQPAGARHRRPGHGFLGLRRPRHRDAA